MKFLIHSNGPTISTGYGVQARYLADHLASVSYIARFKVWTGQVVVSAREWTRAALSLLSITEEH